MTEHDAKATNLYSNLFIPALGPLYDSFSPYSYAFIRFCTGAVLVPHGVQKYMGGWALASGMKSIEAKGLPYAEILAHLTVFSELIAAFCLAIGLFTRLMAGMIWVQMAVIIVCFNWEFGYFWTSKGIEYALLLLLLCTAFIFRGGERLSVDGLIGKEL